MSPIIYYNFLKIWTLYRAILLHSGTICAMEILSSYDVL
jgi:hypothetical protein